MEKLVIGRDFEVEVHIVPLNYGFEPVHEATIIRSATCVSDLDQLMTLGAKFLSELPESDNPTTWS